MVAREARAVDVRTFDHGAHTEQRPARAGDIATVLGLGAVAIGDQLGRWDAASSGRHFPAPGLESVVEVADPRSRTALFAALQELSEQDPLIDARLDGADGWADAEVTVDVYGEVQQEVLAARLQSDYGVEARFLPTRVVHVERVAGTGEGHAATTMGNASLALRVEPAPPGSGIDYALGAGVERGYLLPSFHVAIEETLAKEVREGLYGWRLADATVRVVHSRYHAPTPSAGEFRALTTTAFRASTRASRHHRLRAGQPVRARRAGRLPHHGAGPAGRRGRRAGAGRGRDRPLPAHRHHPDR